VAHGPLRAGFGTLITVIRLPGGHRARSLAPLCMWLKNYGVLGLKSIILCRRVRNLEPSGLMLLNSMLGIYKKANVRQFFKLT